MRHFSLFSAAIMATMLLFAGCDPVEEPAPVLTPTTEGTIQIPAAGGSGKITYTLENAAKDGNIEATSTADWIGGWDYSVQGTVTFDVAENVEQASRDAEITVIYNYGGGNPLSFTVKLTQAAKGAEPALTLTSEEEINAEANGGEFKITYTLENPVENGELTVKADEWITTTVNESAIDVVIAGNESEEAREGTITATYAWEGGNPLTFEVKVKQAGAAAPLTDAFTIEVPEEEITANVALVIAKCKYSEIRWTTQTMSQGQLDDYCGGDKAKMADYLLDLIEIQALLSGMDTEEFMSYFLYYGDDVEETRYNNLTPETKFYTFSVGMDMQMNYTTEFYWGPEFTTLEAEDTGLTFEIEVEPQKTTANLKVIPSDKSAKYLATTLDESFFTSGLTDEEIIGEVIGQLGLLIIFMLDQGDAEGEVTGLMPGHNYYAVAFGVESGTYTYNSALAKEPFTTLPSEPTDAYATGKVTYWDINDLAAYKPEYAALLKDESKPIIAAVEIEYNEEAESCYYALWVGDVTADPDMTFDQTIMNGKTAKKGDPVSLFYLTREQLSTLSVIAVDSDSNYGDMYMEVITLTEEGMSQDFALFDEYYAAQGQSSVKSASAETISDPASFDKQEITGHGALYYSK